MALTNNPVVLGGGSAEANTSATIVTSGGVIVQQPGAANGVVIYNTADQTTNFEDVRLLFTGNVATLITQAGGSGTVRQLDLKSGTTGGGGGEILLSNQSFGNPLINFFNSQSVSLTGSMMAVMYTNTATSGTNASLAITPTYNQLSGNAANTDLLVNRTQTAVGSGAQLLMDLQVGGVSQAKLDNNGLLTFKSASATTTGIAFGADVLLMRSGANAFRVLTNSAAMLDVNASQVIVGSGVGASAQLILNGKIGTYVGVNTTGWGMGAIYNSGRITAQSAAATVGTYTVGAADGSFRVSANMNVTASTVLTTTLTCNYTDESNTARSMILPVASLAGTFLTAGAITGAGATVWESAVMHIRCKASTVITILTSTGTFTGVTYTADCSIMQIA